MVTITPTAEEKIKELVNEESEEEIVGSNDFLFGFFINEFFDFFFSCWCNCDHNSLHSICVSKSPFSDEKRGKTSMIGNDTYPPWRKSIF